MNGNLLTPYEKAYRRAKRSIKISKWIGRAISALLLCGVYFSYKRTSLIEGQFMLLFSIALLVLYWMAGTPIRVAIRTEQKKKLKRATVDKGAFDSGLRNFEEFYFNQDEGLPQDELSRSGLLLSESHTRTMLLDGLQSLGLQNAVNGIFGSPARNNEFMEANYHGWHVRRANVEMYQSGGGRLPVNWITIDLPKDTFTEVRYMSGFFLQHNLQAGFDAEPMQDYSTPNGCLYHLSGEEPTEDLKVGMLRLASLLGDPCEILVQGSKLTVLLCHPDYNPNVCNFTPNLEEEEIFRQMNGRVGEMKMSVDAMMQSFLQSVFHDFQKKEEVTEGACDLRKASENDMNQTGFMPGI